MMTVVDIECSPAVGCQDVIFEDFSVAGPPAQAPRFICQNVRDVSGLGGKSLSFNLHPKFDDPFARCSALQLNGLSIT